MNIIEMNIEEVIPYENNPRNNDKAVDKVAESIKAFGMKQPIVVDKNNIVIVGHTRLRACKKLGYKKVPVLVADDLNEEQAKAYRLADNKTSEFAEWDEDLLYGELEDIFDIDMSDFGFDIEKSIEEETENPYTSKIQIPQYEVTGEDVRISELCNDLKSQSLIEEITEADISEEEKEFLIKASYRHNVFNYRKIAEYYAQASKPMQELMEKSALVIIDFDDAIANGYVKLNEAVMDDIDNE